jgi:hypothetical protein
MKEKKAVIARNPLSQNIAKILKFKEGMLESELRREARIISEKIKEKFPGKSINFETIVSWTLADEKDPNKARMFTGFERLSLFAETVGVNYWELFIPDYFIDPTKLSQPKKDTIEMILRIDDKYMEDIQNVIVIHVQEETRKLSKLYTDLFGLKEKPKREDNQLNE